MIHVMRHTLSLRSLTQTLITVAVLTLLPSACIKANDDTGPPPPVTPPGLAPCGMGDASIPGFTLTDDNAFSPTYEAEISLGDYSGKILLIFWMRAT